MFVYVRSRVHPAGEARSRACRRALVFASGASPMGPPDPPDAAGQYVITDVRTVYMQDSALPEIIDRERQVGSQCFGPQSENKSTLTIRPIPSSSCNAGYVVDIVINSVVLDSMVGVWSYDHASGWNLLLSQPERSKRVQVSAAEIDNIRESATGKILFTLDPERRITELQWALTHLVHESFVNTKERTARQVSFTEINSGSAVPAIV